MLGDVIERVGTAEGWSKASKQWVPMVQKARLCRLGFVMPSVEARKIAKLILGKLCSSSTLHETSRHDPGDLGRSHGLCQSDGARISSSSWRHSTKTFRPTA